MKHHPTPDYLAEQALLEASRWQREALAALGAQPQTEEEPTE